MGHTHDPRQFWSVTKVCLMPSLWWENQPLTAIEAMVNGIPVIGSDRGGLPEALGAAGLVLPLPERLTPSGRILPDSEEVGPWVEEIVRLWDDADRLGVHREKSLTESQRWSPEMIEPLHIKFFREVGRHGGSPQPDRAEDRDDRPGIA